MYDEAVALALTVLWVLIAGRSNKLIGRQLALWDPTSQIHMAAVFRKLDVNSRTQAAVKTASLGLNFNPDLGRT